jgi:hypothetical protein
MVIIEGERGAAAAAGIETRAVRAAVVGSSRLEAEVWGEERRRGAVGGAGGAANTSATAAGRRTNARVGEEEAGEIRLLSPQRKVVFSFCFVKIF